jgi:hypothetical protein
MSKKEHVISTNENVGVICFPLFEVKYYYSSLMREITYKRGIFFHVYVSLKFSQNQSFMTEPPTVVKITR